MIRDKKGRFANLPISSIKCWKDSKGEYRNYIKIKNGNHSFIPYARYLLEQKLGRKLESNEIAHHRNEIKTDDRIENLELMHTSKHTSIHRKGKKPISGIKASQETYRKRRKDYSPLIISLFQREISLREIARITGISRKTVTKILDEGNLRNGK